MLNYVELSPHPGADLRAVDALNAALDGTLRSNQGVVASQQSSMIAGRPTMIVKIRCASGAIIDGKLIYANPRIYQLLVVHDDGKEPNSMKRFLESFTIKE